MTQFWFQDAPPERLAVLRISTGGFLLYYLLTRYDIILRMSLAPHELYEPMGLASYLHGPLEPFTLQFVLLATIVTNVLFILGLAHRVTGPVFAILVLFILSYRNSWSMIYHARNIAVLHVLVLGFASAADALSVDSLWRGRKATSSWHYGWPVRMLCLVTALTYCLAGIAKIAGPLGWGWVFGDSMRSQVAVDALRKHVFGDTVPELAFMIYPYPALFTAIGVTTLIVELGALVALAHRRAGYIWALTTFGMHWGIFWIMAIKFRYQLSGLMLFCFFPVELPVLRLSAWIRSRISRQTAGGIAAIQQQNSECSANVSPAIPFVLYDGVCNFCDRTVNFIIKRDAEARFRFASLQSDLGQMVVDELDDNGKRLDSMVLVDGDRTYVKSAAILRILRQLGGPWSLAWPLVIVPRAIRDFFYDYFAARRYRWFGRMDTCIVPSPDVRDRFITGNVE